MHKGITVDCAAGQAKFRDFILTSDEYFVAISQLYGITQHAPFHSSVSTLERHTLGTVKDISTTSSTALGHLLNFQCSPHTIVRLEFFISFSTILPAESH